MYNLPLASSSWGVEEIQAILSVVNSGQYTMGSRTLEFETQFANWVGRKHAVMVNSGSSANLLAVAALKYSDYGVSKSNQNPEVIVPAVSWITTYSPLEQLGFKIVLVDIDIETYNLDLSMVENAITEFTVGIFGVNLLGNSLDWQKLGELAKKYNLWLLEDNCESMGSKYGGKLTGANGLASTFSFFYSHHICTMEGGMVVTDDDHLSQVLRSMRAHGWSREFPIDENFLGNERSTAWEENFRFYLPGFNLRPLEISAAIGTVQLPKINSIVRQRRINASFLQEEVKRLNLNWKLQIELGESSWFTFGFVHSDLEADGSLRHKLVKALEANSFQSRPIVAGNISRHPVAKRMNMRTSGNLINADHLHHNGLMIGNHHFDIREPLEKFLEILSNN